MPNLLQRRLQDGPPSAFTWNQMLLSLLPASGLEGGTLKLGKCGFGASSHSSPSFSVSRGGDVIKTIDCRGLEIRGRARHADDCDGLAGDLTTGFSRGERQTPGRLAFAAIY